jgi:quercetin dioxygenase-like cupin family protein
MTRLRRIIPTILVAAILAILVPAGAGVTAQEATPAPTITGIDIENLGVAEPASATGQLLELTRVTFEPTAELPPFTQPGTVIVYVDAGSISLTVTEGDVSGGVHIFRQTAAQPPVPSPTTEELLQPNTEYVLHRGDSVVLDHDVVRKLRNTGQIKAVILISSLLQRDTPSFQFVEGGAGMATPAG